MLDATKAARRSAVIFFVLCALNSGVSAQDNRDVAIDFDIYGGGYYTQLDGFSERYGSGLMPLLGGGVSLPMYTGRHGVAITGGASYSSTSGTPSVPQAEAASFQYSQWAFRAGLRYDIPLNSRNRIGVSVGVSRTTVTEKGDVRGGATTRFRYETKVHGSYGLDVGIGGERALPIQHLSVVLWATRTFVPDLGDDPVLGDVNRLAYYANSFALRVGLRYQLRLANPNKSL